MSVNLRTGLLIASILVFIAILSFVVKKKLNIKYSIVWLLWSVFTLFLSIFPNVFYDLSDLLGIQLPVNTVFLIMTSLLYLLTFYVYVMISKHNEEIVKLTYEIASLKKEVAELKNKNER